MQPDSTEKNSLGKKLYRFLTTETPLTRYFFLLLLALFTFVGFLAGVKYDVSLPPTVDNPQINVGQQDLLNTDDIATIQVDTPKTNERQQVVTSTDQKYINELEPAPSLEQFRVGSTSVSFWYPTEEWNDVHGVNENFDVYELQKNSEEGTLDGIDLEKVQTESYGVKFSQKFEDGRSRTDGYLQVIKIKDEKILDLQCYEGVCVASNLLEERNNFDKNFSFERNGLRWECHDGYFVPSATVYRKCTSFKDNMRVVFEQGHGIYNESSGPDTIHNFKTKYPYYVTFKLEDLVDDMPNPKEFVKFIERYNEVLSSITVSE